MNKQTVSEKSSSSEKTMSEHFHVPYNVCNDRGMKRRGSTMNRKDRKGANGETELLVHSDVSNGTVKKEIHCNVSFKG